MEQQRGLRLAGVVVVVREEVTLLAQPAESNRLRSPRKSSFGSSLAAAGALLLACARAFFHSGWPVVMCNGPGGCFVLRLAPALVALPLSVAAATGYTTVSCTFADRPVSN